MCLAGLAWEHTVSKCHSATTSGSVLTSCPSNYMQLKGRTIFNAVERSHHRQHICLLLIG